MEHFTRWIDSVNKQSKQDLSSLGSSVSFVIQLPNVEPYVIGSCNGLVCFKVPGWDHGTAVFGPHYTVRYFLICNPTTGKFKSILPCSEKIWKDYGLSYGFGYDSDHDDYKIVVTSRDWTEGNIDACIYSVKADLWSCPTTTPTRVSTGRRWQNRQSVIFKDNMLHYLVSAEILVGEIRSRACNDYRIARFDVVTEKWRDDLYFPFLLKNFIKLGELDGQLYLRVGYFSSDVWILEQHGSWKKMFHLPKDLLWKRLIGRSKDGRNRLLLEDCYGFGDLIWYDQRDNTTIPFKKVLLPMYTFVMLCTASLVKIPGCSLTKFQEIK
ncbi:F-box/kelch-repeat protein At3g06240-like [Silene latifolia]|uniref:F-box/kelch-repeat protein At3g06240-like n=1 Tax=Silene latifolia TaxID=37657 RepID=UPI003D7772EB